MQWNKGKWKEKPAKYSLITIIQERGKQIFKWIGNLQITNGATKFSISKYVHTHICRDK